VCAGGIARMLATLSVPVALNLHRLPDHLSMREGVA
jgi:hypothetical protein